MFKIGLTGGIGCGKTTVADLFLTLNTTNKEFVTIIDTDIVARHVVEKGQPAYSKIVELFGAEILHSDASINRSKLRKIIFSNVKLKTQLENITHPAIYAEVQNTLSTLSSSYCIIVIPLLFETRSDYQLDRILVVDCEEKNQIKRVSERDKVTSNEVRLIIESQVSREYRLEHADDVIINQNNQKDLVLQVENLHKVYINLLKSAK